MPARLVEIRDLIDEMTIAQVRGAAKALASSLGFSVINQTKLVTATSELARNTVVHGGGGKAVIEEIKEADRVGIKLTFSDTGPGISDVKQAMTDGFTTAGGMGLGLGGSKRLVDEFNLWSEKGSGTKVEIIKWKS